MRKIPLSWAIFAFFFGQALFFGGSGLIGFGGRFYIGDIAALLGMIIWFVALMIIFLGHVAPFIENMLERIVAAISSRLRG